MSRLRYFTGAALLAALLFCAPATAAPAGFDQVLQAPAFDQAEQPTTRSLLRALGDSRTSQATRVRLIKQLAPRYGRLRGPERRAAARYLARPTDGANDRLGDGYSVPEAAASPFCSTSFCVHWVDSTEDAPDLADGNGNGIPDWVETVAASAETTHGVENDKLGWRAPASDGSRGGGQGMTDVYLVQLGGTGVYGYATPDPDQRAGNSLSSYLVVDNNFAPSEYRGDPLQALQVTLAHEYNHVLHFTYDASEDTWLLESTAAWMEDQVYDDVNDYLQYLGTWAQLSPQPITRFTSNSNDRSNLKVYGTSVLQHWLAGRRGDAVVRRTWESSVGAKSFGPKALDTGIRRSGGRGFFDEFTRFAAATSEWKSPGSGFPEGSLYPDVVRSGNLTVDGDGARATLDHTGYLLADVTGFGQAKVGLGAIVPRGTAGAVALVGRPRGGGAPQVRIKQLPKGGVGTVQLSNPSRFDRLTAVLVNADVKQRGFDEQIGDYRWTRDDREFGTIASTDVTGPTVRRVRAADGKFTVTFSEPVRGVSSSTLRLIAPNGRRVRARVEFEPGERTAVVDPVGSVKSGVRYVVSGTTGITDGALNKLRRPTSRGVRARR